VTNRTTKILLQIFLQIIFLPHSLKSDRRQEY